MRKRVSPISPWIVIWTSPRATIRKILGKKSEKGVHLLAMLSGVENLLWTAFNGNLGEHFDLWALLFFCAVVGPLAGLFALYYWSAFLTWTGNWVGGKGNYFRVRVATAWSCVPTVWRLPWWLLGVALFGSGLFKKQLTNDSLGMEGLFLFYSVVLLVCLAWEVVLGAKCLGEAHGFSAWKAYGVKILALVGSLAAWAVPTLILYGLIEVDWGKWKGLF